MYNYVASNARKAVHDELEKNWTLYILGIIVTSAQYDCGKLVRIFGLRKKKWTLGVWNTNRAATIHIWCLCFFQEKSEDW